ncbi:hypothetical protein, partial [Streptosporangium sp. NPDC048865]|uniref:hypothetical protein n=1 Tax=Streptosporangium sp. NPDC048865 TaxID=3155766 RepID=UPI003429A2A2
DNDDERQRRQLLTLRRDVFNRRLPKDMASARPWATGGIGDPPPNNPEFAVRPPSGWACDLTPGM